MIVAVILCLLIAWLLFCHSQSKFKRFASPGICLPIVGHFYHFLFDDKIRSDPTNGIWDMYKRYQKDGLLYMKTLNIDTLWIGDFDTIKYLFSRQDVTGRLNSRQMKLALPARRVEGSEMPGVLMSVGDIWHQQRRFTLKTLRDFGFGKQGKYIISNTLNYIMLFSGMEEMIKEEIVQFKQLLNGVMADPVDFAHRLNLPILNALWHVTVGERFSYDNPKLADIVERLTETFKIFASPNQAVLTSYPWLMYIPGARLFFQWERAHKVLTEVSDMMEENIIKHKETIDVNAPRDFIDMMLIEIENTEDPTSSFFGQRGLDSLKVNLFDLFLAGSETTSTTLTWAVLYMVRYPEVQARLQQELDSVVGINRFLS